MSLDYVARGEGIKASTVNSLIDAVQGGGNMSPDLIVTGTRTGPRFVAPAQLGSSLLSRNSVFDIDNYTLSGWPMAKVKLGSKLQNALEAVRVHTDDGIQNATSALLVFKNSSNCPFGGGTLSGYQLEDSDFGTEAAYGDTGWIKTKMEGVFGQTEPNLQVWKTKDNVIEVIGNVDSDETKPQLSALLSQGGMTASDLSTLKILEQFPLVTQTSLQSKPTSRVTMKHGIVDVYSYSTEKNQRAMLKAYLVCYSVEDGQEGAKDSHWTWLIPMGSGAAYNQTSEGVWTTQFTYGGDPIVLDVEEGALDNSFNGDPTWIEQSEFGNQVIAFGKFDSDGSSEIEPGQVWIDIEYDYQKFAVKGTVNNGENDPPTTQSILGTAIKVAEAESYKPKADVVVGTEVHPSYIFNGTLGDLFKGEPKLDSYTPNDSQSRYSSLQWTERGKNGEQWSGGVTCRCLELYGFDTASSTDPTSADLYVARRFDSETSSATLVYVPLSSMGDVAPDSELSNAETSSLQWRTVSADSGDVSSDLSSDTKIIQLWNFDNVLCCYTDISSALSASAGESHVVLRNASLSCVDYLQLSCLSTITDTQGGSGQKSIDWLSSDYVSPQELQLYGFDQDGEDGVSVALKSEMQPLLTGDYEFIVRKGGAGGEIAYTKIAASASGGTNVDSQHEETQTSSLECISLSTEAGDISVAQIWNFNHMDQRYTELSDALSGIKDVVLRDCDTSCIKYISLSCLSAASVSVDALGNSGQKSISWLSGSGVDELQLYGMNEEGEQLTPVVLSTAATDILPEDYEFVVRKNGAGGEIAYAAVKLIGSQVSGTTLADSDVEDSQTSSLQSRELSSEDGVSTVIQLWNFEHFDQRYYDLSDALSSNDVVLRDTETSCVKYIALSALSSTPVSVDSEYDGTNPVMRSMQWGTYQDDPDEWLQLYGFEDPPAVHDMLSVSLSSGMQSLLPDGVEFLVRTTDERGWKTLEYKRLSAACVPGEVQVDSTVPNSQTSSLETRTVSSENGVSGFAQIWNFEHFDQKYVDLSDALSSNDVILRNTETSCVKYIALSALSSDGANPDAEGESGQKSISWLSGSDPQELQLYKMDEDGETLSAVYLGQTAQSLLPEDYEFVIRKNGAGGEISYATVEAASLSSASSRFQFGISINGSNASISEGAVQIGGYTYFSNGGSVSNIASGTHYICVRCTMGYQAPTIDFVSYTTTQALNYAQGDMTKYIFPIYKLVNGEVAVDYRPMPNAGCWEVAESYSQSNNGGN